VSVPALRVEIVAQTRHYNHAVLVTDTILVGPSHTWAVLFRVVSGLAHRVSVNSPLETEMPTEGGSFFMEISS
jgi:hypothetical protein